MDAITSFDQSVLETLYAARDLRLSYVFVVVSEFGRVPTILGLTAIAILILAITRHYAYAVGLMVSVGISGIGVFLGKGLIERARPDKFYQAYEEVWYSFPSAHAALAAAFYGFLMYIAWHSIPSARLRTLTRGVFIAIIIAVAFSRLYLGVHFLSDVVAGLALGVFSAWLGTIVTRRVKL
ncbi:phosphatase PAP2 family protein [Candidatus Parcubacteria bacterium]|nr:MAG: phosphatase PAP2 family protein [Candidatus Parcubacteria bacterium]